MRSQSDFWLDLHRLAADIDKEGASAHERALNLLAVLDAMTPATCGVYLENLERVTEALNDLLARCKQR